MDVPSEDLKEVLHDGVMEVFAIDGLEDVELLLPAGEFMALEQLVEHILGINEILALVVAIPLVI